MGISELKNHKIGILGFGLEGQAVFSYLKKHGLSATVYDADPEAKVNFSEDHQDTKFISGENYLDTISDCSLIFRSPGIWRKDPSILKAEDNGTIITSQTKLFFENSPAKIIGITGTKGKGTTSSLIYETILASGKKAYLTGNIGKIQPLDFLDELTAEHLVIFELSSFQLQDLTHSPAIGICLMVTSDHLNHHSDLDEYQSAKTSITAFQKEGDIAIFNVDYAATEKIGKLGKGKKLTISSKEKTFPGAYISEEKVYFNFDGKDVEMDFTNRKLRGAHNLENISAAALTGLTLNIDQSTILKTCNDFSGLEHRLQYVGTFSDVAYYNDSISTVPDTTIAALNAFTQPIHLILGGSDKGITYDGLMENISHRSNIASLTFLGETGKSMQSLSQKLDIKIESPGHFTDFAKAIKAIKALAKPGDVVVLSPASASFDMFKNYADRGNQFVELVKAN